MERDHIIQHTTLSRAALQWQRIKEIALTLLIKSPLLTMRHTVSCSPSRLEFDLIPTCDKPS